jgi:hypothetical protein
MNGMGGMDGMNGMNGIGGMNGMYNGINQTGSNDKTQIMKDSLINKAISEPPYSFATDKKNIVDTLLNINTSQNSNQLQKVSDNTQTGGNINKINLKNLIKLKKYFN